METNIFIFLSLAVGILWVAFKTAYSVWWKPRQLAKALKRQGIHGYPYKLIIGDTVKQLRMNAKAQSKPLGLSHDIGPYVLPFYHEAANKYGRIPLTWFGSDPQLIVTDPKMLKELLSTKMYSFTKTPLPPLVRFLQMGVVGLEGEQWATRRKLINPAFHFEKLKGLLPAFSISCTDLVQRWEKSIGPKGYYEVDALEEFQNLTGDVISRTAFGSNYEKAKNIFQLQREQGKLFVDVLPLVFIPGFRFLPTKKFKRLLELNREITSILSDIVGEREKEVQLGTTKNDDLLGLLLESNNNNQEDGTKKMTRDEVVEECTVFYFVGQETTTLLLTWTSIMLSIHPEWQSQAREEVLRVCGKRTPTWDDINHLKIVTMILYEALRLYPPVAFTFRQTKETVELGDITLPAGVRIVVPIVLVHHDREFWGDDANEFKPDRFSEGVSKASTHQLAFFPFGFGPRICIGQSFALLEAKMAVAMILQRFYIELSPSYTHAPQCIVTMEPKFGAPVILRRV